MCVHRIDQQEHHHETCRFESKILVWDLPLRLFHWLLAASLAGAFVTAESERWRDTHVMLGYTVLALVTFRIVWGLQREHDQGRRLGLLWPALF